MSTLHVPVVPGGQVTPGGGAAVATGGGIVGATLVLGADGVANSDDADGMSVASAPGAMGARSGISATG